jgi:hypothetical protein
MAYTVRLAAEKTAGMRLRVKVVATELAHDKLRHSNQVIMVDCHIPPGSGDTVTFVIPFLYVRN